MATRIMLELEPEEKDRELCIEFYLEAFRDYIISRVDYKDLLFYEHFDYDLRGKFRQLRQRESNKYVVSEMIDAILNMKGVPGRFTQLVEGEFSTTENTKVLSILTGQKLPLNQEESKARLKQLNRKEVCDRLDVMTITPFLVQKSVITTTDQETIRNTAQRESRFDAAIDLLQIIANRDEKWFVKFMMALIDSGQIELARFVDEDLCTNIIQEREKKVKENRGHEDLSLNTEIGIANELGCNYGSLVSNVGSVSSVRLSCIGEEQLVPREYDFGDDGQTDETIPKTVDDSTPELNDYCNRLGELEASNVKMKSQIEILAKIIVKALTPDRAQLKLLQTLEKTISGDHHTNHSDGEELMTACTNLDSDLRDQDVDIVKVEEGSILMTLRCPTLSALKKITVYFANRIHETRLAEVEKALSKYVESPVKLTMNIVIETLYSALKQIEKDAHAKSVVLTLQCSGAEGVRNAFDFFGNGSSNNSLNSLSEALSRYVGERVELHAAIDVDQLNTDMKELEELPKEVGENDDERFGDVNTMASDCEEDFDRKISQKRKMASYKIDDIEIVFEADHLINTKVVYLSRERETKTHKIGVDLNAVQALVNIQGELQQIIQKYGDGSQGVSFEKVYTLNRELNLKVFSAGSTVQLDLRRYFRMNEFERQRPMKAGITIPSHLFGKVMEALLEILEEAESM